MAIVRSRKAPLSYEGGEASAAAAGRRRWGAHLCSQLDLGGHGFRQGLRTLSSCTRRAEGETLSP